MSLLQRLLSQSPRLRPMSELSPLRAITERYFDEIEEAKKRGHSWHQICRAVEADAEDWPEGARAYRVAEHYKIIQKEGRSHDTNSDDDSTL